MPPFADQDAGTYIIFGGFGLVVIIIALVLFFVFRPSQDNGNNNDNNNGGGQNGGNGGTRITTNAKRFDSNELLTLRKLNGPYIGLSNGNITTTTDSSQALRIKVVKNPKSNYNAALLYRAYADSGLIVNSQNDNVTYLTVDSNDDVVLKQLSGNTTQGESWQLTSNAKNLFINDGTKKYLSIGNGSVTVVTDQSQASEIRLNREGSS
jgi:hypothetical protein